MSYWRVSADDGWVLRAGARRGQVRVLPAWAPQPSFGTRIIAFAPKERMRVRRNQMPHQMPLAFLRRQFGA